MGRHPRIEHAAAALVARRVLRHDPVVGRLLGRLSGLAAPDRRDEGRLRLCHAAGDRGRSRRAEAAAPRSGGRARRCLDRTDQGRSDAVPGRHRLGQGGLRRQLRRLPRRRRRRRARLPEPQRRRLALGRLAGRDRDHAEARHPRRRQQRDPCQPDAGLRPRRRAQARGDQRGRQSGPRARRTVDAAEGRPAQGPGDLCRQLRRLPWRGGQGQSRARRARSDRCDLALRHGHGRADRNHRQQPCRRDAGLGRTPRRHHDQGADGLCPFARGGQ